MTHTANTVVTDKTKRLLHRVLSLLRGWSGKSFPGSREYWEERYRTGGNSGAGSYSRLAQFKADFLNEITSRYEIKRVIEFGCGDGNQLGLCNYPYYFGVDVSESAISLCRNQFSNDPKKEFATVPPETKDFDLSLSLDVIYHLVENDVFEKYMNELFSYSRRIVVIYSSDRGNSDFMRDHPSHTAPHVYHRCFSTWVSANMPEWEKIQVRRNPYPFSPVAPHTTSFADFHVFEKRAR